MANEITLKTRLLNLYEDSNGTRFTSTSADDNIRLKKGEILFHEEMVATDKGETPVVLMKVGDGVTTNDKLNVVATRAADVYAWAKETGLTITKDGEGNVVSGIVWDASLNEGKGGIKFTTAAVATSEGLEDLQRRVKDIEDDYVTEAELTAAIEDAKEYADNNDANTTYSFSIPAEGDNKGKLVITPSEGEATVLDLITPKELEDILADYATKAYVDEAIAAAKKYADGLASNYEEAGAAAKAQAAAISAAEADATAKADAARDTAKAYADGIKADLLGDDLEDTFNTLKAVQDWVNEHGEAATDLTEGLATETANREAADLALSDRIKVYEDAKGTYATTTQVDSAKTEAISAAAADAKSKADAALEAAKTYADQAEADAVATAAADAKSKADTAESNAKTHATDLNTAMNTRVEALEGIDHEAYKAADTTLHTTISGEIDALANGAVKTNTDAIATINNSLKSAAYTESSAYATAAQGAKADTAVQTVKVLGQSLNKNSNELSVDQAKTALGLGSAAYKADTAFDAAGSAAAAKSGAEATAASALASAKSELEGKISSGDTATLNAAKADATEKADTAKANAISEIKNFYTGGTGIVIGADGSISISESLTLVLDANA
jgi:hypothetical protein